ncbi:MAG: hypothetical protein MZV65_05150 [Chromatiales bacterium]|nr:hypothetical protein [Chromatiales bacterium]
MIFDAHGNDMPEWYAGVDYVLSTSDNESFHFTVADGAAAGCVPVVLPWEGADEIYPGDWIYRSTRLAAKGISAKPTDREKAASFSKENFCIKDISEILLRTV